MIEYPPIGVVVERWRSRCTGSEGRSGGRQKRLEAENPKPQTSIKTHSHAPGLCSRLAVVSKRDKDPRLRSQNLNSFGWPAARPLPCGLTRVRATPLCTAQPYHLRQGAAIRCDASANLCRGSGPLLSYRKIQGRPDGARI